MRTGFPRVDARDDFERARRQARRAMLTGWLRGRSPSRNRLLVLGEATVITRTGAAVHDGKSADALAPHQELAGQALVPIDHIVGTVEPTRCFDDHFRPISDLPRARFERIAAEIRSGRGTDPVDLYRCGAEYYVLDGHHRIAVARALGERYVAANVTEVRVNQPRAGP